ncbi:MAG: hypothetical protein V3T05_10430 [Myxococcota bacterium]
MVYTIVEGDGPRKSSVQRIGSGMFNRDASLSLLLDAMLVSGKLFIQPVGRGSGDANRKEVH